MSWAQTFLGTLKENDVRLVTYVPDNVLTPLIDGACGGPVLLAAKVGDQPGFSKMVGDPALIRSRFMKRLGTSRSGALDQ
jgi:hypothetical protein